MTMNRKIIEKNHYNDEVPPPLPPLRNPQKALESVQAIPSLNDSSVNERDKQIYICSTLKNPNIPNNHNGSHNNGSNGNTHYGTMRNNTNAIKNQTTFNSTPPTTTKPLPSIINTPLPEIPTQPTQQPAQAPKDDIYVKRKFIDQNSKFATLKAIPLPKIEALELEAQRKKMAQNSASSGAHNGPATIVPAVSSPLPPPPLTTMSTAMTTSQIQSLPLPPPPPELIEEEPLPPPPPPVELAADLSSAGGDNPKEVIYATKAITSNHIGNDGSGANATSNGDESSFYAVTEL